MLRPATPLAIVFFAAFVLLLLATLSTPLLHAIPLASLKGINFGVFGFCNSQQCSRLRLGYSTDALFSPSAPSDFTLPSGARHSLSYILVIHPIAAFLSLICFALACAAHSHSAGNSPRYLLGLLIFTIPTMLLAFSAFLVDLFTFLPNLQWGTWIVLAATILILASFVMTFVMRRLLVSRKARKKLIAEIADMSGANFYVNRQETRNELPKAHSPPPMTGSTLVEKTAPPQFATFEMKRQRNAGSTDDTTPLNPARDPSARRASPGRRPYGLQDDIPTMPINGQFRPWGPGTRGSSPMRPRRDQHGNIIPEAAARVGGAGLAHQHSYGSLTSNRFNGYPSNRFRHPPRGPRGGYGPPRGGGGFRDGLPPPAWRGGMRGGYRGQPPPPGWRRGRGGHNGSPPPAMILPARGGRGSPYAPPPLPPAYALDSYYLEGPFLDRQPLPAATRQLPSSSHDHEEAALDEQTGPSPSMLLGRPDQGITPPYRLREARGDGKDSPYQLGPLTHEILENSTYSEPMMYVPPLSHTRDAKVSPLTPTDPSRLPIAVRHFRRGSEPYYEDVDPRFATDLQDSPAHRQALMPGAGPAGQYMYVGDAGDRALLPSHLHPRTPVSSSHVSSSYTNDTTTRSSTNTTRTHPFES